MINYGNLLEIRFCLAVVIHFLALLYMYAGNLDLLGFGKNTENTGIWKKKISPKIGVNAVGDVQSKLI